jgi:WD40 repeat protein
MSQQEKLPLIKEIHSIQAHNETINQISIFPSGNLISVSYDCTIKIWDKNLNILQKINQEIVILCVSIKDNNNFVICTNEIQIWSKNNVNDTLFKLKEKITKIQNGFTNFILYCLNDDLIGISCHFWVTVYSKVKNKNIHQSKITLIQKSVDSLLLLEKDNILIIYGRKGLYFWNSKIWEQKNIYIM